MNNHDRKFNLWQGFAWKPAFSHVLKGGEAFAMIEKEAPIIHDYLLKVASSNRYEIYHYLVGWQADMIQDPARGERRKGLLFKSLGEGTGKDTFAKLCASLLPQSNVAMEASVDDLIRFSTAVIGKLLCVFPEFSYDCGPDSKNVRRNKYQLLDSPTMRAESKGKDSQTVANYARVISTTNDDNPLPKGSHGRRELVIEPSTHCVGDTAYWNRLYAVLGDRREGSEWHRYATVLANMDVSKFDPIKHAPNDTSEMREIVENSVDGFGVYFRDILDRGVIPYGERSVRAIDIDTCGKRRKRDDVPWRKLLGEMHAGTLPNGLPAYHVNADHMRTHIENYLLRNNKKLEMSDTRLGTYLSYFAVTDKDGSTDGTSRGRWWPELVICRRLYELMYCKGIRLDWSNNSNEWKRG
jgi:hypothetical protein